MRHNPASGAIVIMLRSLKMHGMAQAVDELTQQGSPAFETAMPILSQLLKAETAEREVRSTAYQLKAARFPTYRDLNGFDFTSSEINVPLRRGTRDCRLRFPARRDGGQSAGGLARGCPDQAAASRSAAAAGTGFQFHGSRSARRWAGWDAIRPSTSASQA